MLVLLLIAAIGAYKMYNKPHVDVLHAKAYQSLSANDLVKAFNENEQEATANFLDQVLEIAGTVASIETDNEVTTIYLESFDLMKSVSCEMDGPLSDQIEVGSTVIIKGICAGSLMDVVLVQCKLNNE